MILRVGPDIADVWKGKGDDLARIGRVGHDFLIPGHRCVETDFTDIRCRSAKSDAGKYRTI